MAIRIVGLAPEAAGTAPGRQSGQKMPDLRKNRALLVALPFKLPSNEAKSCKKKNFFQISKKYPSLIPKQRDFCTGGDRIQLGSHCKKKIFFFWLFPGT